MLSNPSISCTTYTGDTNCVCSTDLGKEYARKLEQLRREEELIQEEELEAEALADIDQPVTNKVHFLPNLVPSFPPNWCIEAYGGGWDRSLTWSGQAVPFRGRK